MRGGWEGKQRGRVLGDALDGETSVDSVQSRRREEVDGRGLQDAQTRNGTSRGGGVGGGHSGQCVWLHESKGDEEDLADAALW